MFCRLSAQTEKVLENIKDDTKPIHKSVKKHTKFMLEEGDAKEIDNRQKWSPKGNPKTLKINKK